MPVQGLLITPPSFGNKQNALAQDQQWPAYDGWNRYLLMHHKMFLALWTYISYASFSVEVNNKKLYLTT